MSVVRIYTDGACSGNPGPGGWGVWLHSSGGERELWGGVAQTTNNRMELQAVIEGLTALTRPCEVELYTDSQYVQKGIQEWIHAWRRNGWLTSARKPVRNADLWQILWEATQRHQISWYWVKGHAGDLGNERADALARRGLEEKGRVCAG
ncbi:ribonuclease HI [Ferrovum myxofaciens]|nr:ribonuclease HI [Ferrovum myxofaciens]NDU90893.1 ribonuclease HI [Ferrovum sp.]QKE40524.1 MAG: ribonuclease HI [Ferrovum myxofaciens]